MVNTEGHKSFRWHKQLNYDITAILQTWVNTYVNPAELGTNQRGIPCLSCCWKKVVFLHSNNKCLYKDHISGCNYYLIIVCQAMNMDMTSFRA